jgi:hypothetical protein
MTYAPTDYAANSIAAKADRSIVKLKLGNLVELSG